MRSLRIALIASLILVCFIGDQFTKKLVLELFHEGVIPVQMTSFFNFVLAWNKGISFGFLGSNSENMPYILSGFSLLVSLALVIWLFREKILIIQIGLGFIISGAIGNAYDRLQYQAVVDFLEFHYQGWYFPAFNVADICINIGVGLILIDVLFFSSKRTRTKAID